LTVGASTQASEFLTLDSIKIFGLGALSFVIATASGVIFVKIFNLFLKKGNKINPLIGNAGVSAVPDSARISQVVGLEYDPTKLPADARHGSERCRCNWFSSSCRYLAGILDVKDMCVEWYLCHSKHPVYFSAPSVEGALFLFVNLSKRSYEYFVK